MKKDKNGFKRCKHGHPIHLDGIVILGHMVGVCTCGHKYLISEMPACYTRDKRNSLKERFHHYQFLAPLLCRKCQRFMTGIDIACKPMDAIEQDWRKALAEELGQFQTETKPPEEKKDESLPSSSN